MISLSGQQHRAGDLLSVSSATLDDPFFMYPIPNRMICNAPDDYTATGHPQPSQTNGPTIRGFFQAINDQLAQMEQLTQQVIQQFDRNVNSGGYTPRASSNAHTNGSEMSPNTGSAVPLSTAPQTAALTSEQSKQTAHAYVSNLMHDFHLTKDQASGIVANLWHESGGMNSGINQGGAIGEPSANNADNDANGYGIAQWGGARKQREEDYARTTGLDPSSQAANYGYLKQELQTTQSGAIEAVKSTNSAQAATQAFCNVFEKPQDPEMNSRLNDLQQILNA
ncbi:phage tail tip lysozyme [Paraburkholderia sp. CI3]|uniref:phage tail tip lysozyme n=1 Tax=Paraburkholderia sp. CI3 TaxID=2991060 RepID=UPI003D1DA261